MECNTPGARLARMKRTFVPALLALSAVLAATPSTALAWGATGHRMVARLAAQQLTPQARARIDALLAGEPDPTLAGIANWADELRGNDPNLGKATARWHYVNLADHDCDYDPPRDCADGNCAIAAINRQTAILADTNQPEDARLQALKFVVHLVGDVHQPLHAGYARDKGGNDVQINFHDKGGNLHSLWDSGMLRTFPGDEDQLLAALDALPAPPRDAAPALPPDAAAWAVQSCRIVLQSGVYPPRAKIGDDYVAAWLPVEERQLRLAGQRLATLLNAALSSP